ncbi:MAG: cytochrome and DOMON domain-containing protein [Thermoplasmatota archaeon]
MSRFRFGYTVLPLAVMIIFGSMLSFISVRDTIVSAHAPRQVDLSYDIYNGILSVTISHETTSLHYVENVLVEKNGVEYIDQDYTTQGDNPVVYEYDVPAVDGDVLTVTATCNLYGSTTEELTVRGPKERMEVSVTPVITTISEGDTEDFIVNIYSGETPLDGVEILVSVLHGEISDIDELGIGAYQFTYTAGSVDGDTDDTMNLTCTKNGFYPAYPPEMVFKIIDDTTPANQILLSVSPSVTTVDERSETEFTVSVSSTEGPLDGSVVDVTANKGGISETADEGGGIFKFSYTAPTVTSTETARISITASMPGYLDGSRELTLSIRDLGLEPTLDGIVTTGEYSATTVYDGGSFVLHWRISGDSVRIAMVGKTTGYVGIGFDPGQRMEGADMIIGWVESTGDVKIFDAYSEGPTGPHPTDESKGGTDDITAFGGTQAGGVTTIEFVRKLSTGDQWDKDIPTDGNVDIIWALGGSDSFSAAHGLKTGYGTMNEETVKLKLWPIHAAFLSLGFISMLASVVILYTSKSRKWWFKTHKALGVAGGVLSITGLIIGIYMVQDGGGAHLAYPHSYLGIITILMIIASPILAFVHPKALKKTKVLRPIHLWLSRTALLFMLVNIISGLMLAGVF